MSATTRLKQALTYEREVKVKLQAEVEVLKVSDNGCSYQAVMHASVDYARCARRYRQIESLITHFMIMFVI